MERAENDDVVIQFIARKILTTMALVENRVMSMGSSKKKSAAKCQAQRIQIMEFICEVVRFQSRSAKKKNEYEQH